MRRGRTGLKTDRAVRVPVDSGLVLAKRIVADGENLLLTWSEEGGPEVGEPPQEEGFGGVLTHQVIVNQFRGKL
jgi:two-component sensor histidine kinase